MELSAGHSKPRVCMYGCGGQHMNMLLPTLESCALLPSSSVRTVYCAKGKQVDISKTYLGRGPTPSCWQEKGSPNGRR